MTTPRFTTAAALALIMLLQAPVQAVTFGKVKYLASIKDKVKEIKCHLILTKETVQIREQKTGKTLQELAYTDIEGVTYSRSKHRRWKSGAAVAIAAGVFAAPMFFMKGKKHWLTFEATDPEHHIGLRLDKKNYQMILAEVEKRNLKVEKMIED